jgi:hypothetical protein
MWWWTHLFKHKTANLKQLLQHKHLISAFNSLLNIPELMRGMRISTLHKMFASRCDEVRTLSLATFMCSLIVRRFCIIFSISMRPGSTCFSTTRPWWRE